MRITRLLGLFVILSFLQSSKLCLLSLFFCFLVSKKGDYARDSKLNFVDLPCNGEPI